MSNQNPRTLRDQAANTAALFHPAVAAEDNNGAYAPPCIEIGGVQVYAYVRDGILVVSVDYENADISDDSPFALYWDEDAIPTVIRTNSETVWEALPDDAVPEADARIIREANDDDPRCWPVWVVPDWVDWGRR